MLISIIIKNKIYGPAGLRPLRQSRELFQVPSHGIASRRILTINWRKELHFQNPDLIPYKLSGRILSDKFQGE